MKLRNFCAAAALFCACARTEKPPVNYWERVAASPACDTVTSSRMPIGQFRTLLHKTFASDSVVMHQLVHSVYNTEKNKIVNEVRSSTGQRRGLLASEWTNLLPTARPGGVAQYKKDVMTLFLTQGDVSLTRMVGTTNNNGKQSFAESCRLDI